MPRDAADYLDITLDEARRQWLSIRDRRTPPSGSRQVPFLPVETLLCLAGMLLVDGSRFGSGSAHRAPSPVPELARLFRRPATSITSKMANLEGTRPKGARADHAVWLALHSDMARLSDLYRRLIAAARAAKISHEELPDFLGLESGGDLALLGQDEVQDTLLETLLEEAFDAAHEHRPTERETITKARIGQHRFARGVLDNCGWSCVFCGFALGRDARGHLLRASHIKPWRDSAGRERTDPTNGLAACPTHDAAFDAGLVTIDTDHRVMVSARLRRAAAVNRSVQASFGPPILKERLADGDVLTPLGVDYVRWHRTVVFTA